MDLTATERACLATIPGRAARDPDIAAINAWLARTRGSHYGKWPKLRVVHTGDLLEWRDGPHLIETDGGLFRTQEGPMQRPKYEHMPDIANCWSMEALPADLRRLAKAQPIDLRDGLEGWYLWIRGFARGDGLNFEESPKPDLAYVRHLLEGGPVKDERQAFEDEKEQRMRAVIDECLVGQGIAGKLYDGAGVSFHGLEVPECKTSTS